MFALENANIKNRNSTLSNKTFATKKISLRKLLYVRDWNNILYIYIYIYIYLLKNLHPEYKIYL